MIPTPTDEFYRKQDLAQEFVKEIEKPLRSRVKELEKIVANFDWFLSHASIRKYDPGAYTLELQYKEIVGTEIPDEEFEALGFEKRARMLVTWLRSRAQGEGKDAK